MEQTTLGYNVIDGTNSFGSTNSCPKGNSIEVEHLHYLVDNIITVNFDGPAMTAGTDYYGLTLSGFKETISVTYNEKFPC
jgi:hypothetical protein